MAASAMCGVGCHPDVSAYAKMCLSVPPVEKGPPLTVQADHTDTSRTSTTELFERPDTPHAIVLSELPTKADRVSYACTQLHASGQAITTQLVRAWLSKHGVDVARSYASSAVSSWQRERTSGTGDLPKLTPELIAELDAARAADAGIPSGPSELFRQDDQNVEHRPDQRPDVQTLPLDPDPTPQDIPIRPDTSGPTPVSPGPPVRTNGHSEQTRPDTTTSHVLTPPARPEHRPDTSPKSVESGNQKRVSTWVFVLGAVVGLMVSVDTSWRFFGERLDVTVIPERIAMFAGMEIVLVACGIAMFESVRHRGGPGPARWLAWALCGASAYGAIELSGPLLGAARVLFGPVLSVVALHYALGVEIRARGTRRTGTLARMGREIRERFLSRFGLADDERDALTRTRDRAARRAAWLALAPRWTPMRQSRLDRALRKSNAAHDPAARERLLAELATIRHADQLRTLTQPSPWTVS